MKLAGNVARPPASAKSTLPEAARSLEQAWQRRRQELAAWQPTGGWLDPRTTLKRPFPTR